MDSNDLVYQTQVNEIIKNSRRKQTFNCGSIRRWFTVKHIFVYITLLVYASMAAFGLCIVLAPSTSCTVVNPDVGCCPCLDIDPARLQPGDKITTLHFNNNIFYGVLMWINCLFGIWYTYDALKTENKYQLFCILITGLLLCARIVPDLRYSVTHDNTPHDVKLGIFVVGCSAWVATCVLSYHVYYSFGWQLFRKGGTTKKLRRLYKGYQRWRAAARLDGQTEVLLYCICILFLDRKYLPYAIVALVVDVVTSASVIYFVERENVKGVAMWAVCKLVTPFYWGSQYILFLHAYRAFSDSVQATRALLEQTPLPPLVNITQIYDISGLAPQVKFNTPFLNLFTSTFAVAIAFRLLNFVTMFFAVRNFGAGLKGTLFRDVNADDVGDASMIEADGKTGDEEDSD